MYKGNNFPDQTNKNGELIPLFILTIKIRTNRLNSQRFVKVITTLFKLLCRIFSDGTSKYELRFCFNAATAPVIDIDEGQRLIKSLSCASFGNSDKKLRKAVFSKT